MENLKPSVVVASCGVCGVLPGNGRNERFCTPPYLFSTHRSVDIYKIYTVLPISTLMCAVIDEQLNIVVHCIVGLVGGD